MRVGRDRGLWGCVYSIQYTIPLRVLLNLKQVLVLHVGKNVSVVVRGSATLSLADRYLL